MRHKQGQQRIPYLDLKIKRKEKIVLYFLQYSIHSIQSCVIHFLLFRFRTVSYYEKQKNFHEHELRFR